jgi:hypothetical protein
MMELDVAAYRRVAARWSAKEEDINPSAAAVLIFQLCSELEALQNADYEFKKKLMDGVTDAFANTVAAHRTLTDEEREAIQWCLSLPMTHRDAHRMQPLRLLLDRMPPEVK